MPQFLYSLNSSTIKPTPILEKIRIAAQTGYQGIELWHDDIDAYLQAGGQLADIRKALDDRGLKVPTTIMLKGWFDTTGADHRLALDECRRRMEQAVAVGAEFCVAGPPHGDIDYDLGTANYGELLEIGLNMGVKPAMEYLGFVEVFKTIDDALRIVDGCGHPAATIVHDPFHIFRGGGDVEQVGKLHAEQIAVFHFNDAPADPPREQQRDPDRVMPGEGCVDLKRLCSLLRQIGYDRFLSLELFREDLYARDPQEVAAEGLEKMRAVAES